MRDLTARAFAPMPFSDGSEPAILDALRRDGDLALSLVAERDGAVVGHVAFSPVTVGGAPAIGLGPVSVEPALQRSGIGGALIREGLARMKAAGHAACALIGDPGYYSRFGFASAPGLTYGELGPPIVQALALEGALPTGEVIFSPAFSS